MKNNSFMYIYTFRKIFDWYNKNLVRSTNEFAYYTIDYIVGLYNQEIISCS